MESESSPRTQLTSMSRGIRLLQAVNAASASLQRSARSEDDVIDAFRQQVKAFGLSGVLALANQMSHRLEIRALVLSEEANRTLAEVFSKSHLDLNNISFNQSDVPIYQEITSKRRALFARDAGELISQMIPSRFVEQSSAIQKLIGGTSVIFAPLFMTGEPAGMVCIVGHHLTSDDLLAFETFVNHIGIALENASLISALLRNEERYRQLADRLTTIREIDQAILSARSKEIIAKVSLDRLGGLIPFDKASITLIDTDLSRGRLLAYHDGQRVQIAKQNSFDLTVDSSIFVKQTLAGDYMSHDLAEIGRPTPLVEWLGSEDIEHAGSFPLAIRGAIIGALNIGRHSKNRFSDEEIEIAREVADLLAVALQDSNYLEEQTQRRQEAETLIGITAAITSSLEMDSVLQSILDHLHRVAPYESACLFLLEEQGLRAVACRGFEDSSSVVGQVFPKNSMLASQILSYDHPIILKDLTKEPIIQPFVRAFEIRGWMGIPLKYRNRSIGLLTIDSSRVGAFGPQQATLAQAIANQAAITIENARLFAESRSLLRRTKRQATQLQKLMNLVPDGIILLDSNNRIIVTNPAAKAILHDLGQFQETGSLEQLGDIPVDEFLRQHHQDASWLELTATKSNQIYELSARPLMSESADSDWLLLLRNITNVRRQDGYLRAQERLASIGQLAAGIAHDFNNIMTVISLYTQLILRSPLLSEKDEQRLNTIQEQAERAAYLIRQILDFSRQSVVERKPVELQQFMRDEIRSFQQIIPDNIELEFKIEEGERFVEADVNRLRKALLNLVENAVDAMPSGGVLRVSMKSTNLVSHRQSPLPDMSLGLWTQIQISDSGFGILADNLPRIFEPFFTTKTTGQGSGLGLAQVYGIVKLHDGYIDVDSAPGKGTTVDIYLPSFVAPLKDYRLADIDPALAGTGETILLVEDDITSREALTEIMESLNYHILNATNGLEALEVFDKRAEEIDLVISDIVMPVMDGGELSERLRTQYPSVKVILITGYPMDDSSKSLLQEGAVAYIQKPLQVEELARTVLQALKVIS